MSRLALLLAGGAPLLRLTDEEVAAVGGTSGRPFDDAWAVVVGTGASARLVVRRARTPVVARRKHMARSDHHSGGFELEAKRRTGLRRKLQQSGGGWALALTAEELTVLGVDGGNGAVFVQVEGGDPPRLIIRRALTFAEAMEETLVCHEGTLKRLASFDTDAGGQKSA